MCVLHTHTRAGAGLSLIRKGLRPISQDALHVLDDVAYHDYGVPASQEECDALGVTCAQGSCVVLLNHGLLTLGQTIHGALMRLYMLERACEVELMARSLDEPPVMIEDYVVQKAAARMQKLRTTPEYGLPGFTGPGAHGGPQRRQVPLLTRSRRRRERIATDPACGAGLRHHDLLRADQEPSTSTTACAKACGASCGRLCPMPPVISRCAYWPENFLRVGAAASGCGAPLASPSRVIVGTAMAGRCGEPLSRARRTCGSPSARPSRQR